MVAALGMSAVSTAFVERPNGTDRRRNARKARKTYRFSKEWRFHEAVTYLDALRLQLLLAGADAGGQEMIGATGKLGARRRRRDWPITFGR